MKKFLSTCLALLMVLTAAVPAMTIFAATTEHTYTFNSASQINDTILVDHNNVTTTYDSTENAMKMTVSARTNDPYVGFATHEWKTLDASEVTHITIRIKSSTLPGAAVRIWPTTSDSLDYGGITAAAQLILDGEYCDLIYDMRKVANWSGIIRNVRIDISDNAVAARNNAAHIEFIKFSKGSDVGIPVTFDAKGGTLAGDNVVNFAGGSNYGNLPTPTREGYVFEGWYLRDHFAVTEVTAVMPRAHTLYAVWTSDTVRVTLDAGLGTCAAPCKDYTYGTAYGTLPEARLDGATFLGWYTEDGTLVTSDMTVTSDVTLYAEYEIDPALGNPGDVNEDEKIDNRDVTMLLRKLAAWDVAINEINANVNDDTAMDNRDVTTLLRYLAAWQVSLYVPGEAAVRTEVESAMNVLLESDAHELKISGLSKMAGGTTDLSAGGVINMDETLYARFLKDGTVYLANQSTVSGGTMDGESLLENDWYVDMNDDVAYYDRFSMDYESIVENMSLVGTESIDMETFFLYWAIGDLRQMQADGAAVLNDMKYLKTVESANGTEYSFVRTDKETGTDWVIAFRVAEEGTFNRIRYTEQTIMLDTEDAWAQLVDCTILIKSIDEEEVASREIVSSALQTLLDTNSYEYEIEAQKLTQEGYEMTGSVNELITATIAEDGAVNIHSKHYAGTAAYPQENWYITAGGLYYDAYLSDDEKVEGSSVFYEGEKGRSMTIAENWTIGDVLSLREDIEIMSYDLQYLDAVARYNDDGAVYTFASTQKKSDGAKGLTILSFEIDGEGKLLGFEVVDQSAVAAEEGGANATVYKYIVTVDTTTIQTVKPDGFNASNYTAA